MYCTQCGNKTPEKANFCSKCGSPTSISPSPTNTNPGNSKPTEDEGPAQNKTSTIKFLILCFFSWVIIGVITSEIMTPMGIAKYAEATFPTILGFWAARALSNSKDRGWISITSFPVINFLSAIPGSLLGVHLAKASGIMLFIANSSIAAMVIAFSLSITIFMSIME